MTDETVTPAEPTDQPEATKRAAAIADLYSFVAFLSRNSWAPLPYLTMQADLQRDAPDIWNGGAEGVAELRRIADALGEKPNESGDDRTSVDHRFGSVLYHVLSWHKDGRPAEPVVLDERDAELERLRAEVAELRAAQVPGTRGHLVQDGPKPWDVRYEFADDGLAYSREPESTAVSPVPAGVEGHPEGRAATIAVADGHVVHECCGKLDDAPHQNFCAEYKPSIPEHFETRGWKGEGPGSCGVECACGIGYGSFDSIAEAGAVLDAHIAEANGAQCPGCKHAMAQHDEDGCCLVCHCHPDCTDRPL